MTAADGGENNRPNRRGHVTVIGATNRPDGMDAALRRAGRFDREIMLGIPDEGARARILAVQAKKLRLAGGLDLAEIAKKTPGYVGADLSALAKEAAASAVARIFRQLSGEENVGGKRGGGWSRGDADGVGSTGGSATVRRVRTGEPLHNHRGLCARADQGAALGAARGFTTTPEVTWEDVGSLTEVREELKFSVCEPIAHPARFQAMGLAVSTGVLLYGPPGCGKTLGGEGHGERGQRQLHQHQGTRAAEQVRGRVGARGSNAIRQARAAAPCVLFFDELDSLAPGAGTRGTRRPNAS